VQEFNNLHDVCKSYTFVITSMPCLATFLFLQYHTTKTTTVVEIYDAWGEANDGNDWATLEILVLENETAICGIYTTSEQTWTIHLQTTKANMLLLYNCNRISWIDIHLQTMIASKTWNRIRIRQFGDSKPFADGEVMHAFSFYYYFVDL